MGETAGEKAKLSHVAPFFIVSDLERAASFYEEQLGFTMRVTIPADDPFFAIVGRDSVQLHLKEIDAAVAPNPNRRVHEWARFDAFVHVDDPDTLAAEFAARGVDFQADLANTDDGLRGFEVADRDGYVLFFGRPR